MSEMPGVARQAGVDVDVDQVEAVAGFYRRVSLVAGAASVDVAGHPFGTWAVGGEHYPELGNRLASMGRSLAARLESQAQATAELSDVLRRGVDSVTAADTDDARIISHAVDTSQADDVAR